MNSRLPHLPPWRPPRRLQLAGGDAIGITRHFANGHFAPPTTGYIGLAIRQNSNAYYGWADITVHNDYTITLNATGWDDSGGAINAGAGVETPEPASIVLLALGAAGLAAYRRKQKRLG